MEIIPSRDISWPLLDPLHDSYLNVTTNNIPLLNVIQQTAFSYPT